MDDNDKTLPDIAGAQLPSDPLSRIEHVGKTLYGTEWRGRLADGMGVGRTTLWSWLSGSSKPPGDIDARLARAVRIEASYGQRRAARLAGIYSALATTKES
ncbi:transcriptional regulator with XRE-family HTH domain [Rhodopseudomonas rhenobacensis]|uniref:Transcriptional regulator with XRE-family HTH domain n=1 Tax=Rhodopseudomonas rhenobacensis TaxID=87461 RepID=A0A7W8DZG7_9BRAD|nr:helix-turn-helix transcriptional regulator [Rhodopseudomonas rhenobacensis]MBB5046866.1 transcriptional regulator with XRE-family HTH domain [Rhodopseudomonas rhenobacensis]